MNIAESYEHTRQAVLTDPTAATAYQENVLRRKLAVVFNAARERKGWSVAHLACVASVPTPQVQRLLHHEVGGMLTLFALLRIAGVLGINLHVTAVPNQGNIGPYRI